MKASTTTSIKNELNNFLQIYNASQEKLEGWSSVSYAIENEYDEIAEFLIKKGENFNTYYNVKFKINEVQEDVYRKHPFLTAIAQGKVSLVSLMANFGSSCSYDSENKMHIDDPEESWAKYYDSNTYRDIVRRRRALQIAITDCPNPYEMVQILLDAGAIVKQWDSFQPHPKTECSKFMPLTYAILEKRLDIATLLIAYGAPVDDRNTYGSNNPSLFQAIRAGFLNGISLLLENGAKIEKKHLWEAIQRNDLNALSLLLGSCNDNDIDFGMITYATTNGYYEIANLLMDIYTK